MIKFDDSSRMLNINDGEHHFFDKTRSKSIDNFRDNAKYRLYSKEDGLVKKYNSYKIVEIYELNNEFSIIIYYDLRGNLSLIKYNKNEVSINDSNVQSYIKKVEYKLKGNVNARLVNNEIIFEVKLKGKLHHNKLEVVCGDDDYLINGNTIFKSESKFSSKFNVRDIYERFLSEGSTNNYFMLVIHYDEFSTRLPLRMVLGNRKSCTKYKEYASKSISIENSDSDLFLRTTPTGQYLAVITEQTNEQFLKNRKKASLLTLPLKKEVYDIYFEKFASKASESAIMLFEYAMSQGNKKAYYLLDENAEEYPLLKQKYGKHIIEKNSVRAYQKILQARSFISSEQTAHINKRLLDNDEVIKRKINRTYNRIFLQHGVALATDIYNRNMFGRNNFGNFNYVVVSSKKERDTVLERTAYTEDEVLYTGNPNLDYFVKNRDIPKNEITILLTWRPWDLAGVIEEGSYLDRYLTMINFIKEDPFYKDKKVNIIMHPKATEILREQFPEKYQEIEKEMYQGDIREAIINSRVFVTDYSSSVFFAYAGGSHVIFYWEDKELGEEKYGAPNFLQEDNVFGDYTYSLSELNTLIKDNYNKPDINVLEGKFLEFVDCIDGNNAKRTYEHIYNKILN